DPPVRGRSLLGIDGGRAERLSALAGRLGNQGAVDDPVGAGATRTGVGVGHEGGPSTPHLGVEELPNGFGFDDVRVGIDDLTHLAPPQTAPVWARPGHYIGLAETLHGSSNPSC